MSSDYNLTEEEQRTKPPYEHFNSTHGETFNKFFVMLPRTFKYINIVFQWVMLISWLVIPIIINHVVFTGHTSIWRGFIDFLVAIFIIMVYSYNIHMYRPSTEKGKKYSNWILAVAHRLRKESKNKFEIDIDDLVRREM